MGFSARYAVPVDKAAKIYGTPTERASEIYDAFEAIDIAIGHARICECASCDAVMFLRRMLHEAGRIPTVKEK